MWRLTLLAFIATTAGQIPSLGWCPDYQQPIANFDMMKFLGTWYEAERYFTLREIGRRCVTTRYESTPEGRITVSNEITNTLTGAKRVVDGHVQVIGREGEGRIIVKYAALPIPYDAEYSILDTDYENWAVMFSCSGIGPVHIQNAWVLTRDRLAPFAVMQAAYGVLDKYKIYRTFFVKSPQEDCNILPNPAPTGLKTEEEEYEEKKANVPETVDKVVEELVEKPIDPEVKPEVPDVRSSLPAPAEANKPMQVPELIMSESLAKKTEKIEKPEETPEKDMSKTEMPETMELNEAKSH